MKPKLANEYLEIIGWGKYNRNVFIQCGAAWAAEMMWETNIGYILEGAKSEYSLSGLYTGILGSCFTFGMTIGTFSCGIIADRYGRMLAFKGNAFLSTLSSLILFLSIDQLMVAISLFFLGAGLGGDLSLPGTVFYEFCPPSKSHYLTLMAGFWAFGGAASALIALITVYFNSTYIESWRFIVASGFLLQTFCAFFRFFLHETPAFYEESGQIDKMKTVLNRMSRQNNNKELVFDVSIKELMSHDSVKEIRNSSSCEMINKVLSGENLKATLAFVVMYFSAAFSYTSLLYFMPEMLGNLSTITAYAIILMQHVISVPGVFIGSWMVETRFGRRYTILFSFSLAGICCFLFYLEPNLISVITTTSIMTMVVITGYSAMYTINPESFTPDIRNIGVGISNGVARIAAITCPIFTGYMLTKDNGFGLSISLFAGLFFITGISALILKETRIKFKKVSLMNR